MFFASLKTRSPAGLTLPCPFGVPPMPADPPAPATRRRGRQPKTTPHQVHTVSVRLTEAEHQELIKVGAAQEGGGGSRRGGRGVSQALPAAVFIELF
jgi:hypothetical protein